VSDVALYARADGLYEPRHPKAIEICKANAGNMVIADIAANTRSALQNRYLNGWIYTKQICAKLNEAGILNPVGAIWTRNVLHAMFQEAFLVKEEFLHKGRHIKIYESTADMSRKRFCEYTKEQIAPLVHSYWEIHIDDPKDGFYQELYREIMR
jgi:hypothetical protein